MSAWRKQPIHYYSIYNGGNDSQLGESSLYITTPFLMEEMILSLAKESLPTWIDFAINMIALRYLERYK